MRALTVAALGLTLGAGMISAHDAADAQIMGRGDVDPFVRVHLNGDPIFGIGYASSERVSPGVYRVEFERDVLTCSTYLSVRDQAADVDGYADVWTADPHAVWVATWRDLAGGGRESLSVAFDIALRCSPPVDSRAEAAR